MSDRDAALAAEKQKRLTAYGLVLSLAILTVGLTIAVIYVVRLNRQLQSQPSDLTNAEARDRTVAQLVLASSGVWDSHPDPDVGRVLQPNLQNRQAHGSQVDSNAFGWRERQIAVPKPADVLRVVILGDSFVWGPGVAAEDRLGVFLEKFLAERLKRRVEVLHVGMGSWNTRAECEYLRRNISNIGPSVVVQIAVSNDLDDSGAVRGFGVVADFSSQHPERASSLYDFFPVWGLGLGFKKVSHLNKGLSFEGRHRYEENAALFGKLARAVTAAGGRYLLIESWMDQPRTAAHHFRAHLEARQITYLPSSFRVDPRFRIGPSDPHWSRGGGEQVAKFIYGAMRARGLLEVPAWEEAERVFRELDAAGEQEVAIGSPIDLTVWEKEIASVIEIGQLTEQTGAQIYGGVDKEGFVSPYASMVLKRAGATRVRITGRMLDAGELRGSKIEVWIEEVLVKELAIEPNAPIDLELELPPAVRERPFFDVRFTAGDWVYRGPNLRQCVALRLERIEALP